MGLIVYGGVFGLGGRVLVVDCRVAGVSGDMLVGALLDLGVDRGGFVEALGGASGYLEGCERVVMRVREVRRGGLRALRLEVVAEESFDYRGGGELRRAVEAFCRDLGLSGEARGFALRCVDRLVEAEAKVHDEAPEEVHLHEAGSVDTLVDVVGAAYCLEELGLLEEARWYSTPVAVGGGLFRFSHGVVSSPAPATLEILRGGGIPLVGGPVEAELATPTGAAILVSLVEGVVRFYPLMRVLGVGLGAGARDFEEMPNVVRVVLGEGLDSGFLGDEVWILETNLDDVSGEVVGYALERLLGEGARDVCVVPVLMKKGRPGVVVRVIADADRVERLCGVLVEETGTLGVRVYPCRRFILDRGFIDVDVEVEGVRGGVRVKVSRLRDGRVVGSKPEFEDVRGLAVRAGVPLRVVEEAVRDRVRRLLRGRLQGVSKKSKGGEGVITI